MSLREAWTPKPPFQPRALAAFAQGKLQSAFGPERARRSSRLLVVSSSQFVTNPFAYAGSGMAANPDAGDQKPKLLMLAQPYAQRLTATILTIKNTLDWMSGDEDLIATSLKDP